jgi:hypothetical protein
MLVLRRVRIIGDYLAVIVPVVGMINTAIIKSIKSVFSFIL